MGKRFAVLGNGIAGFSAAAEILRQQPDGEITIISDEKISSYLRPLLSKTYFKTFQKERILLAEDSWYQENSIRQILGCRIEEIIPEEKQIRLSSKEMIPYDKCIYALGSGCFVPPFRGADKAGVMTVRNTKDFDRIRKYVSAASRAVVIGGGVIGLEMAWEISKTGCRLTILEAAPRLMGRLLDEESSCVLAGIIEKIGIPVFAGVRIEEITGKDSVTGVKLADGSWFPADFVIVSCGVRANAEPARKAGISCDRGVLVNEFLQTSAPDIYAAGDCMQWKYPNPGLWRYSKISGETAGYNASSENGEKKAFVPAAEPVILDAMGISLFSVGSVEEADGVEIVRGAGRQGKYLFMINRHDGEDLQYAKYFYKNGRLQGAVLIGDLSQAEQIKREIAGRE